MNNAHQKTQRCIGLSFLKYEGLAEFLGLIVISVLTPLLRHCSHFSGDISLKPITTSELLITRTDGFSVCLATEDPFHSILISTTD
ncbi:hypothetical protein AVEN_186084-1 [Araneus ventricosus]|uniref:Uncharacterized protein n=1 Tax=Araneus ventricosus TaxID=182803 RepID=A0A4Y2QMP1_ARAVE|nr:hypothetical protein AVEN_186084-1 [Araneus ventricosus]